MRKAPQTPGTPGPASAWMPGTVPFAGGSGPLPGAIAPPARGSELPLVGFTLLAQTAAGLVLWMCLLSFVAFLSAVPLFPLFGVISGVASNLPSRPGAASAAGATAGSGAAPAAVSSTPVLFPPWTWWVPVGFLCAALFFSLFHLGRPARAGNALAGWRSSRLSREIFFAIAFGAACVWVASMGGGPDLERAALSAGGGGGALRWIAACCAACLCGIGLISSMAGAYRLRTVPAWDRWTTPAAFGLSAALLGAIASGVLAIAEPGLAALRTGRGVAVFPALWVPAAAAALLALQIVVFAFWVWMLHRGSEPETRAAARVTRGPLLWIRLGLAAGSAAALVVAVVSAPVMISPLFAALALSCAGFALGFASEWAGRVLFYRARVRHGL